MEWSRKSFVAICAVILLILSLFSSTAVAAPDVRVNVNGQALAEAGTITVNENPTVTIDVVANSTIDSVSVRVDGDTRKSFAPDSKTFSTESTLKLTDGEHQVKVIVSANDTTSISGKVLKDSTGPRASYTSPFTTDKNRPPDRVTVSNASVVLAADLFDATGVSSVKINWKYEYKFAGNREVARETYRIRNPGNSFSQPLLLGLGRNQLKITLTDAHGQIRQHETVLYVQDDQKPVIAVHSVNRTSNGGVRITGRVSDNVKVNELSVRRSGSSGSKSIITSTDKEPEKARLSKEFSTTISVGRDTDAIELIATDVEGNRRVQSVSLDFEQQIKPEISVTNSTLLSGGSAVHVVGTVDNGQISNVNVETVGENGTIQLKTVYSGEVTSKVLIDTRLKASGSGTEVRIRVIDSQGREHVETIQPTPAATTTTDRRSTTETSTETETAENTATSVTTNEETAIGNGTPADSAAQNQSDGSDFPFIPAALVAVAGIVGFWTIKTRKSSSSSATTSTTSSQTSAGHTSKGSSSAGSASTQDSGATRNSSEGETEVYDPTQSEAGTSDTHVFTDKEPANTDAEDETSEE